MKIVHILYGFELGGIETMLVNIANEQVKKAEVHIVVVNNIVNADLKNLLCKDVAFHCLMRKRGSKSLIPMLKLNMLLRSLNPDVIHLHSTTLFRLVFGKGFKRKSCLTFHSTLSHPINYKLVPILKKIPKIFSISQSVANDLKQYFNIDSEIVYNGINVEKIKNCSKRVRTTFRIVQVGRLEDWHKGQHVLIQAVDILVKEGFTNFHVDFIGEGSSRQELEELVSSLLLNDYISFLGSKSQTYLYDKLCDYDLFVQPSIFEGFGLTVTEAMAAKVPVLVSENEGPLEIIENGKYGYSFENANNRDCANKIKLFLQNKNDKEMIDKAYERVVNYFNIKTTAFRYLRMY